MTYRGILPSVAIFCRAVVLYGGSRGSQSLSVKPEEKSLVDQQVLMVVKRSIYVKRQAKNSSASPKSSSTSTCSHKTNCIQRLITKWMLIQEFSPQHWELVMFCEKLTKLRLFTCHETIGPSLYLLIEYCDNRLKVFWVSDCRLCNIINVFIISLRFIRVNKSVH